MRDHMEGQGMGGGGEASGLLPVDPMDRAGRGVEIGGVHEEDEVGLEAAELAGDVLGRGTRFHELIGEAAGVIRPIAIGGDTVHEPTNDDKTSGIVAAEFVTNADEGEAGLMTGETKVV